MRGIKFLLALFLLLAATAQSKLVTKTVEYKHGDVTLEGYLAYDDATAAKRPGVIVVHEWYGVNDHAKKRADKLASLGYVAFAIDMYGKGVRPQNNEEAGKQAAIYKSDRKLMRSRAQAGMGFLRTHSLVDPTKLTAIGFCFGGTTVLELARSGAELDGVVSFHGGLDTPNPADAENIKCKILVLHGGDDPFVPKEHVEAFEEEMRQAGVDWQLIAYGGAVHSFTNPAAGSDNSKGAAYNQKADQRSWQAMQDFFNEIFK
jgi:dienelactone hydrolase